MNSQKHFPFTVSVHLCLLRFPNQYRLSFTMMLPLLSLSFFPPGEARQFPGNHVSFRLLRFVLRCFITHLPWRCCQSVFNSYIQCWRLGGCNTLACARRQTSGWNVSVINDNSTTANNQTPTLDYNYDKEHGLPKKQMQLLTIKCFSVRVKYG